MSHELTDLLSAQKGHFKFESGHHGDLWLNLDLLFLHPRKLHKFIKSLADRLSKYKEIAVCGPLVGGALTAQMVASELDVEFYYTEQVTMLQEDSLYSAKYRLPQSVSSQLNGKKIIIIDDVVNAGSAVRSTFAELKSYGAQPIAIGTLLLLGYSASNYFSEQGIPIESVATLPNNLWTPIECPLCASNKPLDNINK